MMSSDKFQFFGPRVDEARPVRLEEDVATVEGPEVVGFGSDRFPLAANH